jgi:hypothetical protein
MDAINHRVARRDQALRRVRRTSVARGNPRRDPVARHADDDRVSQSVTVIEARVLPWQAPLVPRHRCGDGRGECSGGHGTNGVYNVLGALGTSGLVIEDFVDESRE